MKNPLFVLLLAALAGSCTCGRHAAPEDFVRIEGCDLIRPDGRKLFIRGTNLGNWLNPEGYMFGFGRTNSARHIDEMFRQIAGPDFADAFWQQFKDNYIARADIEFIASTVANTIRLPFHYKLFTDEDYMGLTAAQDGFARVDSVVRWCRDCGLYLILDMHDAPAVRRATTSTTATAIPGFSRAGRAAGSSATSGAKSQPIIATNP